MSEELERHKEALKVVIGSLRELGLDYAHFTDTVERRVATILEPAPEFEDVPVVRWMLKDSGEIHLLPQCHVDNYVQLTGTVKRPVKRAVVREVSVEAWRSTLAAVSTGGRGWEVWEVASLVIRPPLAKQSP